jgi:hypothetical protein
MIVTLEENVNGPTALTAIRKPWTTAARARPAHRSHRRPHSATHTYTGWAPQALRSITISGPPMPPWRGRWRGGCPKDADPRQPQSAILAHKAPSAHPPLQPLALYHSADRRWCPVLSTVCTALATHSGDTAPLMPSCVTSPPCALHRANRLHAPSTGQTDCMRPPQGKPIACALHWADRLHAPSTGHTNCMRPPQGTPIVHAMPCHVMHHAHRAARPRPRLSLKPFTGAHAASPAST